MREEVVQVVELAPEVAMRFLEWASPPVTADTWKDRVLDEQEQKTKDAVLQYLRDYFVARHLNITINEGWKSA